MAVDALPLAAWEGATYRSWGLVIGGAVVVIALALGLFLVAGSSPMAAVRAALPSLEIISAGVKLASGAVQNAPVRWQVGIAVAFVVVNTLFFLLLRRAPKGLDA